MPIGHSRSEGAENVVLKGLSMKPDATAESLGQLEDRYLDCRDFRHAWSTKGYWQGAFAGFYNRQVVCSRCKTVRIDRWEGSDVKHTYTYPDGYKVEGRVSAVHVRDERLRRVTVYRTQEEMLNALKGKRNGKQAAQQRSHRNVVDLRDRTQQRTEQRRVARARAAVSR